MLFKPYHIEQIRDGRKTATRREWSEDYNAPNVGSVIPATTKLFVPDNETDCYIRIVDHHRERLGDLTDADAQKEGDYETVAEFREGYRRVYGYGAWDPDKTVDVVEFEYVGRSRADADPQ